MIHRCDIAYRIVEDVVFNEQCKVDVQHVCEEHINIPILHHPPIYGPLKPAYPPPEPAYATPETLYGPPEPVYSHPEPLYAPAELIHVHPEALYAPPEPIHGHPEPTLLKPNHEPPKQITLTSPPEPIFTLSEPNQISEQLHQEQLKSESTFDKSEKLVLLPSELNTFYNTHFSTQPRRMKRDVDSNANPEVIFPQLGGVLLFGEELKSRQRNVENQDSQLSNIVRVYIIALLFSLT